MAGWGSLCVCVCSFKKLKQQSGIFLERQVPESLSARRISSLKPKLVDAAAFDKATAKVLKRRRGEFAPAAIVECIKAACSNISFEDGMEVEAEKFSECLMNPQSRALQYFFFAERTATKVPGLTAKPVKLHSIGIIGGGLMGGGIAMSCAEAGINVFLLDISQEAIDKGIAVIKRNYDISVQRGTTSQEAGN